MRIMRYREILESSDSEFKKMIDINNSEYDKYYDKHNKYGDREGIVAWEASGSQMKNFKLTKPYIEGAKSILDYGCGIGDYSNFIPSDIEYFGVDINPKFIELAKETYPDKNFKLISSLSDVEGRYDVVVAIGVFTWYISRQDFIDTIAHLYKVANKRVVITVLWNDWVDMDDELDIDDVSSIYRKIKTLQDVEHQYDEFGIRSFWKEKYRIYDKYIIEEALPNYNIEYNISSENSSSGDTAVIVINK